MYIPSCMCILNHLLTGMHIRLEKFNSTDYKSDSATAKMQKYQDPKSRRTNAFRQRPCHGSSQNVTDLQVAE
jgi:hypothetical protein